jgi:L-ascorbate metabolism protein UlaG (beta-lactamase superfamily)
MTAQDESPPQNRPVELTWLGQAGFALVASSTRILIDPFIGEHELRRYAPPPIEDIARDVDWLLITHEHLDHLDPDFLPVVVERSPQVQIVLPSPLVEIASKTGGRDRLHPVQPGDSLRLSDDAALEVVSACHAVDVGDAYGDGSTGDGIARFVGYLLQFEGLSVYHAGDTLVTTELLRQLTSRAVDVALLPINGRDYFRERAGLVGNMGVREAVGFAAQMGAKTLVPMHWDLFVGNTERPGTVLDEVVETDAGLHVLTLARMRPYRLA